MKNALLKTVAASALLAALPPAARADAETDALRAEIKALEARLDQLENREQAKGAPARLAPAAGGNVEQRLSIVERKQEVTDEIAQAKAEKTPAVDINHKGFTITSPDKQYSVNM